jgi:hypothetical protein
MFHLSSKQVKDINLLYESIYTEVLTEENQNDLLGIYLYNALVEEGLISGEKIDESYEGETLNEVWGKIAGAVSKYGPKVMQTMRNITGFGLGKAAGGKRRIITTGAGTATALDPQKAADVAGQAATTTASTIQGAVKGGIEGATGRKDERKSPPQSPQPGLELTPQGTIRVR